MKIRANKMREIHFNPINALAEVHSPRDEDSPRAANLFLRSVDVCTRIGRLASVLNISGGISGCN